MMRSPGVAATTAALALLVIVLSIARPAGSGPATKAPPFRPGATWAYRHIVVAPSGETRTGTWKDVYGGPVTYRGRRYHYIEQTVTLIPGLVERIYIQWAGTHFRQFADVATDAQGTTVEIIFDRPIDLGVQADISGAAAVVENGVQKSTVPLLYTATPQGTTSITVPAGTFQATGWSIVFRLGQLEQLVTAYLVGTTTLRIDAKVYTGGAHSHTQFKELVSGPVR